MAASASAAGGQPQKQFLSIIRDFAAEKSHGGKRPPPRGLAAPNPYSAVGFRVLG